MKKALTFEVRGHLPGTNMFAEQTFKTEVSIRELPTVMKAVDAALGKFTTPQALQAISEIIIVKLPSVKTAKSVEILNGPLVGGNGSYRVLAKEV